MTRGEIILRSKGALATINTPQYGYRFEIRMSMRQSDLRGDGLSGWWDNSIDYDSRVCILDLINPADKHLLLEQFTDSGSLGRGNEFDLIVPKGIYPFGPDLGDGRRSYKVRILDEQYKGAQRAPWLNFETTLTLALIETKGYHIPSGPHGETSITIGPVRYNRFPDGWIDTSNDRSIITTLTHGQTAHALDRTNSGDAIRSQFELENYPDNIARVIYYLQHVARGTDFKINTENGVFLFGAQKSTVNGAGNYIVRLNNSILSGRHVRYNQFSIGIELQLVDNNT
jgi:hypothetical protein